MPVSKEPWPHAPTHQLSTQGVYFVTASTCHKSHHFRGADRLRLLHQTLLEITQGFGWKLEAWAVFSNHYHFVAHSPPTEEDAVSLPERLCELHSQTAREVNRLDSTLSRQVWYNYWETRLTFQKSYLARLNYVHQNPVRHRLVAAASQYPWCSAAWFERSASAAMVRSIYRFKIDQLSIADDYPLCPDW
jgi:putative transposase